jgi:hypothetical protein
MEPGFIKEAQQRAVGNRLVVALYGGYREFPRIRTCFLGSHTPNLKSKQEFLLSLGK